MKIILGILILITVVSSFWLVTKTTTHWFTNILAFFFYTILGILFSLILCVVLDGILWQFADKTETKIESTIYSINRESTISGNFLLGFGSIDNKMCYSYYVGQDTNSFILEDSPTKNTKIVEDEELNPYIIKKKYVEIINKEIWNYWQFGMIVVKKCDTIEIHVPRGTINRSFKNKL